MAIRPLDVKELAEVLAVDFDDAEGIPKLKTNWRWEDEEQALLTSCSGLITIVDHYWPYSRRVVQFSHFSVKEFLTSARLATSSGDISRYHIDLEPAHTILAQACMSALLQPDEGVDEDGVRKMSPLAGYAAQHWVTHAQFERVSRFLRKAMEYLFDLDKPYFATWLRLHDIDICPLRQSSSLIYFAVLRKYRATPLYYAALCGFDDLVEHLVTKYPEHMDTYGGFFMRPLVAALARRHFQTTNLLHRHGTDVNLRIRDDWTPLGSAARCGDLEMVQVLLDYEADVNVRDCHNRTPIHYVSFGSEPLHNIPQSWPEVTRILLEHGADVNAMGGDGGDTPLHCAAGRGRVEVMLVLLEHGANVDAQDNQGRTPLLQAVRNHYPNVHVEAIRVLLEHGANVGVQDNQSRTPLHNAVGSWSVELERMLLEHGANVGAQDNHGRTPLHEAARCWDVEFVRMLLEYGANVGAQDDRGKTPLHEAAVDAVGSLGGVKVVRVLLEHGANADVQDNEGRTPLLVAASSEHAKGIVHVLLEHGANVDVQDNEGRTPLLVAVSSWQTEGVVRELLEHGANVDAQDNQGKTPLHLAAAPRSNYRVIDILLERGANVRAQDNQGKTTFQYGWGN